MELTEFATYRNVLGGLMKSPLLFTQYTDIKTEDFGGHKVSKIIFATINNMFQNGISTMTPIEVDMEIERYEAAATIYRAEKGLDYLNDCYEYSALDNFDYYYKRLKKLSLIRTLKKNHYDVSYFFKEDCDTLQEENELIERFDKATMEDIFQHIERNYNEIRSAYLTDAKVNAVAADGVRALIDNFKVHPEIGFDMEGSLFSYACRGARLGKFYLRSAQSGTGKAIVNTTPIPTPNGWKTVGDIKVGDYIFGKNGKPTKVLNLYKHTKKIWRITFADGRTIDCCGEHLWEYYDNGVRRVENTQTIYTRAQNWFKNFTGKWRFSVPMNEAVEYPEQEFDISPCEVVEKLQYIPKNYLIGSIEQRIELLNSLPKIYNPYNKGIALFAASKQMVQDIRKLCNSLGLMINNFFLVNSGYGICIEQVDRLPIVNITPTEEIAPMTCFTVDADDCLFQVGDYIVTHNTRLAVFDACKIAYPEHYDAESKCFVTEFTSDGELRQPQKTLFITTEMDKTEIQTIMISYLSGVNEKHILTAQYEEDEEERILYAERIMEKYQDYFYLEEISDPNLTNVEALIKRYVSIEEVKVIFFDYIFTSPSLLAQFSGAKIREDSALGLMANQLKQIAKDYNVFIMSSTQVNGEGMANEGFKDERCLRGAKSLADKCDFACIVSRVTDKDLQSVSPMLKQAGLAATANSTLMEIPTHVIDIYKNRRGGLRGVRVWTRLNLGTGERKDLCITRDNNTPYPIEEFSEGILRSYKMVPYTKWKEALNGE